MSAKWDAGPWWSQRASEEGMSEPRGRGRRRSQAESRPQLRFRKMPRAGSSDPGPAPGGPWPLPGPSPLTPHPQHRLLARIPAAPARAVGLPGPWEGLGVGAAVCRGGGAGAQLGRIWPERRATKWDRKQPFIPRGAGRPQFLLATGRPEDFGDQLATPAAGLGFEEICSGRGVGRRALKVEFNTGAFSVETRVPARGSGCSTPPQY